MNSTITIDTVTDTLRVLADPFAPTRRWTISERIALLELARARREGEALTLSRLGHVLGLSRAAITSLADRFEENEVGRRVADSVDRRLTRFEITAHGERLLERSLTGQLAAA